MANPAQQYWHNAQKVRRTLSKQLEQLERNSGDKSEEAQLEAVERLLSDFRLACVTTVFADFRYATKHGVEDSLWALHTSVNSKYRSILGDLKVPQQIVTKRKVEKLYTNYLRTSQYFYRGYIQRLWARYDAPEIGRIAQSMRLETMPNATVDEEATAEIQAGVIKSCHASLLHLGDLSRYRHKMRQKLHGSETALTYYSLAQDLNPDSGFAHHQMGVIYLEEKNHFEIVYHFYRAWAAQAPHPIAKNNLEVEFKNLLHPSTPGKRTGPPDPNAAFISWFVRLHARFFKGETFPEHGELEEEVLHRFETALKTPGTFTLLLKMVLVNISAYHVAQTKVKTKWTYPGSTSCQFILRLNVRFVLILSRLLKSELRDIVKAVLPVEGEGDDQTSGRPAPFKPYAENILPLLRIYMTWTCTYRTDIVKYEEHLDPYVHDMYRTLGQALTMVIQEFLGQDLATSHYLLPEDLEALGLKPLDDTSLPSECRLHYRADQNSRKPRPGDLGCVETSSQQELLSRIYDILSCGYFLATDRIFPFTMVTVQEESRDITAIAYQEEGASQQFDEPTTQALPDQPNSGIGDLLGKFGDLQASPDTRESKNKHSFSVDSLGERGLAQEIQTHREESALASPTQPMGQPSTKTAAAEFESEFNVDSDMYHLVNDFLAPPESRTDHASRGVEETSYGMHSSTANEVFGSLQNKSPTPGSATAKAFPTLPWDFFISPAPHPPSQEGATKSPEYELPQQKVPGSPEGPAQYRATRNVDDPFTSQNGLQSPFQDTRTRFDAMEPIPYTGYVAELANQGDYGRQTRANYAGISQSNDAAAERFGARFPDLSESSGNPMSQHGWPGRDAYSRALDPPNALNSGAIWQGSGSGVDKAPFSSNFSRNPSSLPPINSPWGMPPARQTLAGQQRNMYPFGQHGTNIESSAPLSPPNHLYHSNGNYYNATTAFGRGPIVGKDDPTHFRNVVKRTGIAAAAEAADAYDRAILAGALLDDNQPRR